MAIEIHCILFCTQIKVVPKENKNFLKIINLYQLVAKYISYNISKAQYNWTAINYLAQDLYFIHIFLICFTL